MAFDCLKKATTELPVLAVCCFSTELWLKHMHPTMAWVLSHARRETDCIYEPNFVREGSKEIDLRLRIDGHGSCYQEVETLSPREVLCGSYKPRVSNI